MSVMFRGNSWQYEFMVRGARYYGSLPTANDEREAVALEHAERLKVYRGEWRTGPDVTRFGDSVDKVYMPYSRAHKESWRTDEYRCEELKKRFGHFPLVQITPKMLADYAGARLRKKSRRGKSYSPATVKKRWPRTTAARAGITAGLRPPGSGLRRDNWRGGLISR